MVIYLDTENTTKNKGNPFTTSNKCCVITIAADEDSPIALKIEYDNEPFGDNLRTAQRFLDMADWIVGFNIKYDIHWLRRYGINVSHLRVWDCQVAQFIIEHQRSSYPSLDSTCAYWGLGRKLDIVAGMWKDGIDTPDIPWEILETYAIQDVKLTRDVYKQQQKYLEDKPKMKKLVELDCLDLVVLEEMEFNGIKFDVDESKKQSEEIKKRIDILVSELNGIVGNDNINWNSGDQVSAVLYGGEIKSVVKELVPFVYKDGRTKERLRNVEKTTTFPRLVEPKKGSELKKFGVWQTGSPILKDLKAKGKAKQIIDRLVELSDLEKLTSTYLDGLPKLIEEMEWSDNTIHGNLNQCVAVTGRLSSTKPNMQNNPHTVDLLFRSRYD